MRHKKEKFSSGFSIIEMMVATLIVFFLGLGTYKVLTSNARVQTEDLKAQKFNKQAISAIETLRNDLRQIDPSWGNQGVQAVYPHFCLGADFYWESTPPATSPNPCTMGGNPGSRSDAVTFLVPDKEKPAILKFTPATLNSSALFGGAINVNPILYNPSDPSSIVAGDLVLIYQTGTYLLAKVSQIESGPGTASPSPSEQQVDEPLISQLEVPGLPSLAAMENWPVPPPPSGVSGTVIKKITFAHISDDERQKAVFTLAGAGGFSGFVKRAGLVEGSFDSTGLYTGDEEGGANLDNEVTFNGNDTRIRAVKAFSYGLQRHPGGETWLGRVDWAKPAGQRLSYLMPLKSLNFTFDLINWNGIKGISKDLGLVWDGTNFRLGIPTGARDTGSRFIPENETGLELFNAWTNFDRNYKNIVAVRAVLGGEALGNEKKFDTKVAINEDLIPLRAQSGDFQMVTTGDMQVDEAGQPLYLDYGTGAKDIVVAANRATNPNDPSTWEGMLILRNESGTLVGSTVETSLLKFPKVNGETFLPRTIATMPGKPSPMLVVGGIGIKKDDPSCSSNCAYTRVPKLAYIDLAGGQRQFRSIVSEYTTGTDGPTCFEMSNSPCRLISLPSEVTSEGLFDTAGGITAYQNKIYITSLSKAQKEGAIKIFSGSWNSTDRNYQGFSTAKTLIADGQADEQISTGVAGRQLIFKGRSYLTHCTANRNTSQGDFNGHIDILPVNANGSLGNPITVARHNGMCRSVDTFAGTILAAGRLTAHKITTEQIQQAIAGGTGFIPVAVDLDEKVGFNPSNPDDSTVPYAAYTRGETYNTVGPIQNIFNLRGMSIAEVDPLNFRVALTNKSYTVDSDVNPVSSFHDASVTTVSVGGYLPRLIAALKKMPALNKTIVRVAYAEPTQSMPNRFPLGQLMAGCPAPNHGVAYPCEGRSPNTPYTRPGLPTATQNTNYNWIQATKAIMSEYQTANYN